MGSAGGGRGGEETCWEVGKAPRPGESQQCDVVPSHLGMAQGSVT